MAYPDTTFPTTLDNPTNPTGSSDTASFDHSGLEAFQNNAIKALETKVGANSSAVTTTHDYKLSGVTGSDKAVSKTGTETLTNKTLTSPSITTPTITSPVITVGSDAEGDLYYRNNLGAFTRLPLGPNGTFLSSNGTIPVYSSSGSFAIQSAIQNASYSYAADAGATDAYAITLSPAPASYTTGMVVYFTANTVNTGAATLNVNGLGAKTIVKGVNTTLVDGDIAAGQYCTAIYDGTNFVLQNPVANTQTSFNIACAKNISLSNIENGVARYCDNTGSGTGSSTFGNYMPIAGTLKNFTIKPLTNAFTQSSTYTIRINGSNSTATVTIPAGSTTAVTDSTHFPTIAQNDIVDIVMSSSNISGDSLTFVFSYTIS